VTLTCVYNPSGEDRPYAITFHGCSQIRWEALDEEQASRDCAELLGIELGAAQHQRPALISTDAFELAVWYDHDKVQK
jgi:hypothetical protein